MPVDKYYAAEIDGNAVAISDHNYPDIIQMGDIRDINTFVACPDVDLIMAGSPCQDLSKVKSGKGLYGEKSVLFFEFYRLLTEESPKWFLLENTLMDQKYADEISTLLGIAPIIINSSLFSAQHRERLYWTNIPILPLPPLPDLRLGDILQDPETVPEKYWYKEAFDYCAPGGAVEAKLHVSGHDLCKRVNSKEHKCQTLTAVCGGNQHKKVIQNGRARKLTPLEYERLQTLPDGYTAAPGMSDSARYKAIGNGWTVDVIAHILRGIPNEL